MSYDLLLWLVDQEAASFQQIENRWKPTDLLMELQTRALVKDMSRRFERLEAARDELSTLDRADLYLKLLRRMGVYLEKCKVCTSKQPPDFCSGYDRILYGLRIGFEVVKNRSGEGPINPSVKV